MMAEDMSLDERLYNFELEGLRIVDVITENETIPSAMFKIRFKDRTLSDEITLPLKGLEKQNWYDVHPRIAIYGSPAKIQRHLANHIRAGPHNPERKAQHRIDCPGFCKIDGIPMFYSGGQAAIWPPGIQNNPDVVLNIPENRLAIDTRLTEREAATEMIELVKLSPDVGRFTLAYNIANLLRDVYEDVFKPPGFVLIILGDSGTKKTFYTSLLTQLYDRDKGIDEPSQLKASFPAARKIISETICYTEMLDDLFPAKSSQITRDLEEKLENLIRFIGNQKAPH